LEKIYYIVDIKKQQKNGFKIAKIIENNAKILALTPYSFFLLDRESFLYETYHSIISIKDFSKEVLNNYTKLEEVFSCYPTYSFLFREFSIIKTYEVYLDFLYKYIKKLKNIGYKIVYITDANKEEDVTKFNLISNNTSGIHYCQDIDKTIILHSKDNKFYFLMKQKKYFKQLFYKRKSLINLLINKILKKQLNLNYDHNEFQDFWNETEIVKCQNINLTKEYTLFRKEFSKNTEYFSKQFIPLYEKILANLGKELLSSSFSYKVKPFSYISNNKDFIRNYVYYKKSLSRVFWQHGSYLHEHIFLYYNEIYPADINFVYNEYTEKLFLKEGATSVYNVGTLFFNKKIKERKKVFDYVYIINNMHYSWSGTYIDSKTASYSMDGYNLYERHKAIINLFGCSFKDKQICIKMQPAIVDSMLYVPLLELSRMYKNITIEFFIPLNLIIEKSKYIISDYFSSEFINRDIHYQRDIILFKSIPTPLPQDTIIELSKMFILVDTVDELKEKLENIGEITKNRKRDDSIIEYYSSRKCDTKKIVNQILEREINGR
jgi:hypothetical protein